ncbi:MAG: 16S rRNA (guanine(966)-N(2))-methyltransferase RsmD [Wenzhouxiangellaceae bacterium]|nr:16S rRNA (guanine(966)-N(2))-methyltransferase RsmD [Wenzhouxiangellaceae bacterium]
MTGRIRIIGGQWRGRKLDVPDRPGLRPTGDRARETLFNWLQAEVPAAHCLDLFAGTGALGLEAASRGAARVVLVERDRALAAALKAVAGGWPGGDAIEVVQADARAWLERAEGPWDLAFVDPPFEAGLHAATLGALEREGLLSQDAVVYVESAARDAPPLPEGWERRWTLRRDKSLGEVRMQLWQRSGEAAGTSDGSRV